MTETENVHALDEMNTAIPATDGNFSKTEFFPVPCYFDLTSFSNVS